MRSTLLKILEKHCGRALDYAERGTPYTRDVYAVGIAAHAMIQRIAEIELAKGDIVGIEYADALRRSMAVALATEARSFDGQPEPPMDLAAAEAGVELAADWYRTHGIPTDARAEVGIAVASTWQAVPYGPTAFYRGILDLIWVEEDASDEESAPSVVLYVRDYKSAWNDHDPLTPQLKGQALLARAWAESEGIDYDAIELQIGNLRTRQVYTHRIWNNADGREEMREWRVTIEQRIAVAKRLIGPDGWRPARPGAGCATCPWIRQCDAAQSVALSTAAEDLIPAWLAARAIQRDREAQIKAATRKAPIEYDGATVGYQLASKATPEPDAPAQIVRAWYRDPNADSLHSEAHALVSALKPGAGSLRAAAKALHPGKGGKDARIALESKLLAQKAAVRFGVKGGSEPDAEEEEV